MCSIRRIRLYTKSIMRGTGTLDLLIDAGLLAHIIGLSIQPLYSNFDKALAQLVNIL
jgi:hypothetical protein